MTGSPEKQSDGKKAEPVRFEPPQRLLLLMKGAVGVAVLAWIIGFVVGPTRTFGNLLLCGTYLAGLGVFGLAFLAFQQVANAGWHTTFKRVPEAMISVLPVAGVLLLFVFFFGMHALYEWSHEEVMQTDPLLAGKAKWLNPARFLVTAVLCLGVWVFFGFLMRRISRGQDETGSVEATVWNKRVSALFIVLLAITFSVATFDWLMSLEPHWFSTIFAVYHFSGVLLTGFSVMTLLLLWLRRTGPFRGIVTEEHLHDLGKLIFGFSSFWAYIWFSQYMLIWYGNLPEETMRFALREQGLWAPILVTNLVVNWGIPFFVLMPRPAKRSPKVLFWISCLLVLGHWLDLYIMIFPSITGHVPPFGPLEMATLAGGIGLFGWAFLRGLSRAPVRPTGDPYYEESLHHHQ